MRLDITSSLMTVSLDLRSKVTLVMGDSGTGKTFLISSLNKLAEVPSLIKSSSLDISEIETYSVTGTSNNYSVSNMIKGSKSKIILIDEFHDLMKRKDFDLLLSTISSCKNKRFIFMTKDFPLNCGYTDRSIAILNASESEIHFDFIFDDGVKGYVTNKYKLGFI